MLVCKGTIFKAWHLQYDFQNPWASTMHCICLGMDKIRNQT